MSLLKMMKCIPIYFYTFEKYFFIIIIIIQFKRNWNLITQHYLYSNTLNQKNIKNNNIKKYTLYYAFNKFFFEFLKIKYRG